MKISKKILIGIMIVAGIMLLSFWAFVIWFFFFGPKMDVTNMEWSYSIEVSAPIGTDISPEVLKELVEKEKEENEKFYSELNWYPTLEEALQDSSIMGEDERYKMYVPNTEFFRVEDEDKLIIFYTIPNGANEKQLLMSYHIFALQDGKISQPYQCLGSLLVPGMGSRQLAYDCDDAVVDYIILEFKMDRALDEHMLQMFFGTWPNREELESLTLAGIPLQILDEPIVDNGKEYYFWYITDLSWTDRLSEIPWSSFTYGDVIDILDIEYESANTDEK